MMTEVLKWLMNLMAEVSAAATVRGADTAATICSVTAGRTAGRGVVPISAHRAGSVSAAVAGAWNVAWTTKTMGAAASAAVAGAWSAVWTVTLCPGTTAVAVASTGTTTETMSAPIIKPMSLTTKVATAHHMTVEPIQRPAMNGAAAENTYVPEAPAPSLGPGRNTRASMIPTGPSGSF